MFDFKIPEQKKVRVILDTDAKNEVDDQFAIVQALLTQSFDINAVSALNREKSFGDGVFLENACDVRIVNFNVTCPQKPYTIKNCKNIIINGKEFA